MDHRRGSGRIWTRGVPIRDRGPGESYRPEDTPPSVFGAHQPGVTTPVLDHLAFAALDLTAQRTEELCDLIGELTSESERLMRAKQRPFIRGATGSLTVTLGLGPGVFDERFGLAARQPVALAELPAFPGDALDRATSGGELSIQVCADTLPDAKDALARLITAGHGAAVERWSQSASMCRRPGESPTGRPRNLLGFKDATANPRRGKDLDRHVWVGRRERSWMLGGTFLVVRRVRVLLDAWSALSLAAQERVIGRHRESGAPLGRRHEFERIPLDDEIVPPTRTPSSPRPGPTPARRSSAAATATTTASTATTTATPACYCCSTNATRGGSSSRCNAGWLSTTRSRALPVPSAAPSSLSRPEPDRAGHSPTSSWHRDRRDGPRARSAPS